MDYKELENKVTLWANARNILAKDNAKAQYMKFIEEAGELARGILKNNKPETVDALGDVMVTLIILSKQLNLDLIGCLEVAYNEIKDREGKTVNGTFIKSE